MSSLWLVRGAIALSAAALFRWAWQKGRTDAQIAAAILLAAPWFFDDVGKLIGFCGGVAATLWIVLRVQKS